MKKVLHRLRAALRSTRRGQPDVEGVTPLVHLLEDAQPDPNLFMQIEARLDAPPAPILHRGHVVVALVAGLVIGGSAMFVVQDRQSIVARPQADASWVPLGSVTLHGSGLRGFVRAKCDGYTHFLITMHGHSPTDDPTVAKPLMDPEEKILMECIF